MPAFCCRLSGLWPVSNERDELGYLKDNTLKVVEFGGQVGVAPAWLAEVLEMVKEAKDEQV